MAKVDAVYARYSSDAQDAQTISVQVEVCERHAGHKLHPYIDEAKTGRALIHRDALLQLIEDAKIGQIGKVYVIRYDRLGRDERDTFSIVAQLEELGCEIISATEGKDVLSRGIHLVMASYYSRELAQKTRRGLIKSHELRKFTGGVPPYGYKVVDDHGTKRLAVNEEEAAVIHQIYDLYLGSTPVGLKEIAKRLTAAGVPTRSMIGRARKNSIGQSCKPAAWSKGSVRSILENAIYTGTVLFNRRSMKLDRSTGRRVPRLNDPSQVTNYQDESLRIIAQEQFASAGARLGQRRCKQARGAREVRPLTSLLYCQECGAVYCSRKSKNAKGEYHYMVCGCRQRKGPEACGNTATIREDMLLAVLRQALNDYMGDLDGMVTSVVADVTRQSRTDEESAERLRKQLKDLDTKAEGITNLLIDPAIAAGAKPVLSRQLEAVGQERARVQARLDDLLSRAHQRDGNLEKRVRERLAAIKERFDSVATAAELHQFIEDFVGPSVVTKDGRLLDPQAVFQGSEQAPAT